MLGDESLVDRRRLGEMCQQAGEERNIADKNPEIVAKIEAYLKTARSDDPDWPIRPNRPAKAKAKSGVR